MEIVTVSSRSRSIRPHRVRESIGIHMGQKMQVIICDNRIELIPIKPIAGHRGFLRGIDTTVEREADRE